MDLLIEIKEKMMKNGIAFFGTGYIKDKLSNNLSDMPYAISMGMRYPKMIIEQIKTGPTATYFHQYRTMNANLDRCGIIAQSILLKNGFDAMYIPASQSDPNNEFRGIFSHKTAAVKSGLGFIGKNNLFISNDFGPSVRLMTILTNMELPKQEQIKHNCEDCNECFKACPAGAIYGVSPSDDFNRDDIFSPEKCSHYMKTKFKHIGRGSVCGICIGVCPFSK